MPRYEPEYINAGLYGAFTVRQGISAREGLSLFRAAGGHISNQRWFALVSGIRESYNRKQVELAADVNSVPSENEITTWESLTKRGYFQQVQIVMQDSATKEIVVKDYTSISATLKTRREVISEALALYTQNYDPIAYPHRVIGAAYTGTYTGGGNVR